MKKVLIATQKPFAKKAVEQIKEICKRNNYELILLEKYEEKSELIDKIKKVDALIVRSDKITEEIIIAGFGWSRRSFYGENTCLFWNNARPRSKLVSVLWTRNARRNSQCYRDFER